MNSVSQDPDFIKQFSSDKYLFTCKYIPAEILALKEIGKSNSEKGFNAQKDKFDKARYFEIIISRKDGQNMLSQIGSQEEYTMFISQLSFTLENSVKVVVDDGRDSIKPLISNFSNTYGNSKNLSVIMAFNKSIIDKGKKIDIICLSGLVPGMTFPAIITYKTNELNKKLPKIKDFI